MSPVFPVFVVGAARSGTTALAAALSAGAHYVGAGEGHLLPLLDQLCVRVREYYRTRHSAVASGQCLISHVPEELAIESIRTQFRSWCEQAYADSPWFDKTPDHAMIRGCPELLDTWPKGFILYATRRGIDNLLSRTRKFENLNFENACREWTHCVTQWNSVRDQLRNRYLEIDQLDMATKPYDIAAHIADALHLDVNAREGIAQVLANQRPERTSVDGWIPLSKTNWSKQQSDVFRARCGEAMRIVGYGEETYRLIK